MLENLKGKIIHVQQDLSASFRNLKVGDNLKSRSKHAASHKNYSLNAGSDVLHYFQRSWEELHHNSEVNAQKADEVATVIDNIHKFTQQQVAVIHQFNAQLATLPKLQASVVSLMGKIGELEGLFEEVESSLVVLEDIIETQELQEKQLDHRFRLALYKEKKLSEFEQFKARLAVEHAKKVQEFEQRQQVLLKERQEAFREAFEEEMYQYKVHGKLERVPSVGSDKPVEVLEEIDLEETEDDKTALDSFLAEEATEDAIASDLTICTSDTSDDAMKITDDSSRDQDTSTISSCSEDPID